MTDSYQVLNLDSDVTMDEVKKQYRILVLQYHPDKNNNSPDSTKKFMEIQSAYDWIEKNHTESKTQSGNYDSENDATYVSSDAADRFTRECMERYERKEHKERMAYHAETIRITRENFEKTRCSENQFSREYIKQKEYEMQNIDPYYDWSDNGRGSNWDTYCHDEFTQFVSGARYLWADMNTPSAQDRWYKSDFDPNRYHRRTNGRCDDTRMPDCKEDVQNVISSINEDRNDNIFSRWIKRGDSFKECREWFIIQLEFETYFHNLIKAYVGIGVSGIYEYMRTPTGHRLAADYIQKIKECKTIEEFYDAMMLRDDFQLDIKSRLFRDLESLTPD